LGERLLCKQEVVGSIPSGSTNTALAESRISPTIKTIAGRHLLHREEGIDLRLPQPQAREALVEECRHTPVSSVSTACCWVDLDEIWS
jgi:hypothetical protein